MMWPEIQCVTIEEMEENCFDTAIWWAWNCIHRCSHQDNEGRTIGWAPAIYYGENGFSNEVIDTGKFQDEYTGALVGINNKMCNGKLVQHASWQEPLALMFIDIVKETAWALPIICPVTFTGYGYVHHGKMCFQAPLTEFEPIERTHPSEAALAAEINSTSKILADGVLKESLMIKAATLYSQEWPSTKFLDTARRRYKHFFLQCILGLQLPTT